MATWSLTDTQTSAVIESNPLLAALGFEHQTRFVVWSDTDLTYTLNKNDANPVGEDTALWTDALTNAIELAHADVEAVCNISFTEVADAVDGSDGADIDYWAYSSPDDAVAGFSYGVDGYGVFIDMADIYTQNSYTGDGLVYGGLNYRTVIHELLHNLGLAHPHDGYAVFPGVSSSTDTGDFALNQNVYTVMSYNSVRQEDANGGETTGYPFNYQTVDRSFGALGTLDIAMLQALYGANMTHATGDNVYLIANTNTTGTYYKAIWDAGGTDEFRYEGSDSVTIDLRAATLDVADGMLAGGMISKAQGIHGGLNIAFGAVIENATGGNGDDILVGNDAGNLLLGGLGVDSLLGGSGADTLDGGAGADVLEGGDGVDTLDMSQSLTSVWVDFLVAQGAGGFAEGDSYSGIENVNGSAWDDFLFGDDHDNLALGGDGDDSLHMGRGNDSLFGGRGNDALTGGAGDDSINGGTGDDRINGGRGADSLDGGTGFDWLDYSTSLMRVSVDLALETVSGGDAEGDQIAGFEAITGSPYGDRFTGDTHDNIIDGGAGRDVLDGGAGNDRLIGGADRDTFIFSFGSDTLEGGEGIDTFISDLALLEFDIAEHEGGNWTITHLESGDVSILTEVEILQFSDLTIL